MADFCPSKKLNRILKDMSLAEILEAVSLIGQKNGRKEAGKYFNNYLDKITEHIIMCTYFLEFLYKIHCFDCIKSV
jgi:hypothetical protein